jgi:cytidylate kinase
MSAEVEKIVMPAAPAPVVAIDGPSGSGKGHHRPPPGRSSWVSMSSIPARCTACWRWPPSSMACRLDNEEGAGSAGRLSGCPVRGQWGESMLILEGEDVTQTIRTEEVGAAASRIAALPGVRAALLQRQHAFRELPGLVADGRDMGTVCFPDACLKIFLTASAEARAERRYKQLLQKGFDANLAAILEDIRARDLRDTQRTVAPMKPAADAIVLDSTALGIEAVLQAVIHAAAPAEQLKRSGRSSAPSSTA